MEELDKLIQQNKQLSEEKNAHIFSGKVFLEGKEYNFEQKYFYDNTFCMFTPISFTVLPEKLAKMKYPSEHRPEIILTNDETNVNFALKLFDVKFEDINIEPAVDGFKKSLKKINPSLAFYDTKLIENSTGVSIGYFDFRSPGYDEALYQLFAFLSLNGQMLQLIFNCTLEKMAIWKNIFIQILDTCERMEETQNG